MSANSLAFDWKWRERKYQIQHQVFHQIFAQSQILFADILWQSIHTQRLYTIQMQQLIN